jgi:hypothetical protein
LNNRAIFAAVSVLLSTPAAVHADTLWRPADVRASSTSSVSASILAGYAAAARRRSFEATIELQSGQTAVNAALKVRALDYRVDVNIAASQYAMGRSNSQHWRRTPAGTVRIIESDVQSDELDRWPSAVTGIDAANCTTIGSSAGDAVFRCEPANDVPHWYYLDTSSGRITREITREGSHVVTYAFDDFRPFEGGELPYHWTISGAGGEADARITATNTRDVAFGELSVPSSSPYAFAMPDNVSTVVLPATFAVGRIDVPVTAGGRRLRFVIDTGTTQVLMDRHAAAAIGLQPVFDHAILPEMRVGGVTAGNVPVETLDLFGGKVWDGILGNEFFKGHIVHIDYQHGRIELIPHERFTPPSGTVEMPMDVSEGMPLISAAVNTVTLDRVALDTGSYDIILGRRYFQPPNRMPRSYERPGPMNFLEGPLHISTSTVEALSFSKFEIQSPPVDIVEDRPDDLDIPLNGIFGDSVLRQFDLWFDYDGSALWLRYNG